MTPTPKHSIDPPKEDMQPSAQEILQQLRDTQSGLAICWLGNDSWMLRGQGRLIAFDLDLRDFDERLRKPIISAEELAPFLDAVFVSHSHNDHFRDTTAIVLAKKSKCIFVLPANCVQQGKSLGIPDERIVVARPKQEFDLLGIHVEPMHAIHGHRHQAVHRGANLEDCGYILTFAGLRIFQPGDSILTHDQLAMKNIDLLFISPTSHNMAVEPAKRLIETLRPRCIFPQHFGTYKTTPENDFWTVGQPDELEAALEPELRKRFHKLRQGQVFVIDEKSSER